VVLLVVITLLTLFAVVGIAFVFYAQAEATAARVAREAETVRQPDADPELLLAYYLSQLIYGTSNQGSQLRYHSLAENMYGAPGSIAPFNGTGRLHTGAPDDYYNIDYSYSARSPYQSFSPNAPYTYPDFNNIYLAAVRASDGGVLIPSFWRRTPQGTQVALRARGLPPPEDGNCDVKNLADSPGLLNPTTGQFTNNDSVWTDVGFPVMRAPDGRKFKPLFAALVQDLDNRVNVNVHGHIMEATLTGDAAIQQGTYQFGRHTSDQGWGPWEVSLERILSAPVPQKKQTITTIVNELDNSENATPSPTTGLSQKTYTAKEDNVEATNIFIGNSTFVANGSSTGSYVFKGARGRYDPNCWSAFATLTPLPAFNTLDGVARPWLTRAGTFYSKTNFESEWVGDLPNEYGANQMVTLAPTQSFPNYPGWYANGSQGAEMGFHALQFNFFNPAQPGYSQTQAQRADRTFPASNMEALLRYGDRGSPALTSDLFQLCPNSFANAKTRRLVTTHAFDVDRPGATPWVWPSQGAKYSGTTLPPSSGPIAFPASLPAGSEFTAGWQINTSTLGPININRPLTAYPSSLNPYTNLATAANNSTLQTFLTAQSDRVALANEIFNCLKQVTGASNNQPDANAQRWLAQLAVNIVDYRDNDDFLTPFPWTNPTTNKTEYVVGCELPRLVINEVYAELVNNPADPGLTQKSPKATMPYQVRFWIELLDPLEGTAGVAPGGKALLGKPPVVNAKGKVTNQGYAAHRLVIAQNPIGAGASVGPNEALLRAPGNALGDLNWTAAGPVQNPNIMITVQDYTNVAGTTAVINVQNYVAATATAPLQGMFVIGPGAAYPSSNTPAPVADLQISDTAHSASSTTAPVTGPTPLFYTVPLTTDPATAAAVPQTILLQRLACPYIDWNDPNDPIGKQTYNAALPYNPYVTIDYLALKTLNDRVTVTSTGKRNNPPPTSTDVTQCNSVGRTQPYAANQLADQKQNPALTGEPQTTLFTAALAAGNPPTTGMQNLPAPTTAAPYRWLTFIDRELISPMELLEVSGYPPHLVTQQFISPASTNGAPAPVANSFFQHRVPWFDEDASLPAGQSHLLYRALEYLRANVDVQMAPVGGRAIGRININTIWDKDTFMALADPYYNNYSSGPYTSPPVQASVDQQIDNVAPPGVWQRFLAARTPNNGVPGPNDRPFLPLAAPFYGAGPQTPPTPFLNGASIDDTFLRADPLGGLNGLGVPKRLFEIDPTVRQPGQGQVFVHPYLQHELMRKIYNNTTTRSNVFALWLTVGFFEVTDDSTLPPTLGAEIGRAENRHVRHRMFAIIDRTNLTLNPNSTGQPGPRPFFLQNVASITTSPATNQMTLPFGTGIYEDYQYQINAGSQLIVDIGPNQEVITVANYNPLTQTLTATANFAKAHQPGAPVTNVGATTQLGNPGPQPLFDPRNPTYRGIVRYFSIIE